ncbi:hypothetical protein QL285_060009 [Trifolium repens]|nr:hypothetical protein QL285_060009 [Trifolium repens]
MDQTILVTMSAKERSYREALENARQMFLDLDSSSLVRVAGYLTATSTCCLSWNFNRMNFNLNLDAIKSLFRMRNQNQQCPGCEGDLVNVLLACNHAYCYSWHGTKPFIDHLFCPHCLTIEFRDFIVPSNKMLAVLDKIYYF